MVATGGVSLATQKLVGLGFTVMNAKQIVQDSKQLLEEKDPEKRAELAMGILLTLAMMGYLIKKGKAVKNEGESATGLRLSEGGSPAGQSNEPRLPPKGGATREQSQALPERLQPKKPENAGAKAVAAGSDFMKPTQAGNEQPSLVGAGGTKGSGAPRASGGGGPSDVPPPESKSPGGGSGGGGSPPKAPGEKPSIPDFMKKPGKMDEAAGSTGKGKGGAGQRPVANWRSELQFGHAFKRHGQAKLNNLIGRARGWNKPQGMWRDNQIAADLLAGLDLSSGKPFFIKIPPGLGSYITGLTPLVRHFITEVPPGCS